MNKLFLLIVFFLIQLTIQAQEIRWKEISKDTRRAKSARSILSLEKENTPTSYKIYSVDFKSLQQKLNVSLKKSIHTIQLPTSNGIQEFVIKEASSFSKGLSEKYPMIQSFIGYEKNNIANTARISIGSTGLYVEFKAPQKENYYIQAYPKHQNLYISYAKSSLPLIDKGVICDTNSQVTTIAESSNINSRSTVSGVLRTYRMAVTATGEYSQYHVQRHGLSSATDSEKKTAVLSEINIVLNTLNAVYERELGTRFLLIDENDKIIFLDPDTDGLSSGSTPTLLSQSAFIQSNEIGLDNYDLGHCFDKRSSGGFVGHASGLICTANKGRSASTSGNVSANYYANIILHEMGHQMGANHTFHCRGNNNGVEPGSGTTIMSYGFNSVCKKIGTGIDYYYHDRSIQQILSTLNSTNCAVEISTSNVVPVADAGFDYSIPKSTPFVLKGSAVDENDDTNLTYAWEQIDILPGQAMPPRSSNVGGPVFRSRPPSESSDRYMPRFENVVAGTTSEKWEVVPSVARDLNFALNVRDNYPGAGATDRDLVKISVVDTAPFVVTYPFAGETLHSGISYNVLWDSGDSHQSPINCKKVRIKLSTDGGITFPIILGEGVANDGNHQVNIPIAVISTQALILIEAEDNIFYTISAPFVIDNNPAFIIDEIAAVNTCHVGENTAVFTFDTEMYNGFNESITFSVTGQPNGAEVTFSPAIVSDDATVTMTISNYDGASIQEYPLVIKGTSTSLTIMKNSSLRIFPALTSSPILIAPSNNATEVEINSILTWEAVSNTTSYQVQFSEDEYFTNVIQDHNVTENNFVVTDDLLYLKRYYWRVKAINECGESNFSNIFNFETGSFLCNSYGADYYFTSITQVTLNTLNHSSGRKGGYFFDSNLKTNLQKTASYPINVSVNTAGSYTTHTNVWIDWNKDNDFEDPGESYNLGTASNVSNGATTESGLTIQVPLNAVLGNVIMRVSTQYNSAPFACSVEIDGEVEDYILVIEEAPTVVLAPKIFLEGAYKVDNEEGFKMIDALRGDGDFTTGTQIIPLTSPYTTANGYPAYNATADQSVFTVTGNKAIVDWVYVELRTNDPLNTINPDNIDTVVSGVSGLLLRDGTIVATDGVSPIAIHAFPGDYYISISHRNHLPIAKGAIIALTETSQTIDFTNNISSIRGNTFAVKELETGVYGMISGYVDGSNGKIQSISLISFINSVTIGTISYSRYDSNMNAEIQTTDFILVINSIGTSQQF